MSEIVIVDGRGEDLRKTHNGGMHAPSQSTQQATLTSNAQCPKPLMKTQATVDSKTTKRNHTRDSLSERALTAKNVIQLMRRIAFKDLTPTTWNFL